MTSDSVKLSLTPSPTTLRCHTKLGMKEDGRNREGRLGEREMRFRWDFLVPLLLVEVQISIL